MKKILYISSFLPYDTPFAGSKTVYRILDFLSEQNEIDIQTFVSEVEIKHKDKFIQYCDSKKNINIKKIINVSKVSRLINAIMFFYFPIVIVMRFNIRTFLSIIFKRENYDLIYVDWSQSIVYGYFISFFLKKKVVFSIADVITQSMERKFFNEKKILKKFFYWFEYKKLLVFENFFLKKASQIIVQSEKDKKILIGIGLEEEKILTITPYFNQNMKFNDNTKNEKKFNILFWGAMNRIENIDAVEYFLEKFHQKLKNSIPNYKFIIAGANPPEKLIEKSKKDKSIYVTGFLDDPSQIFNKSHISVIPLRLGAGIKVKTLESLFMGLPTVSTSVGAEGIYLNQKDGLYVSDNEEKFFNHIMEIYNSYDSTNRFSIHNNVKQKYNFGISLLKINEVIESF